MWGHAETVALLTDIDADRHINDSQTLPVMTVVTDFPSAVRAT